MGAIPTKKRGATFKEIGFNLFPDTEKADGFEWQDFSIKYPCRDGNEPIITAQTRSRCKPVSMSLAGHPVKVGTQMYDLGTTDRPILVCQNHIKYIPLISGLQGLLEAKFLKTPYKDVKITVMTAGDYFRSRHNL